MSIEVNDLEKSCLVLVCDGTAQLTELAVRQDQTELTLQTPESGFVFTELYRITHRVNKAGKHEHCSAEIEKVVNIKEEFEPNARTRL